MEEGRSTPRNILGLLPEEIADLIQPLGARKYTASQVFGWVYAKGVRDFDSMHNLPKALRKSLAEKFAIEIPCPLKTVHSLEARVSRHVLGLSDEMRIECVLIGMRNKDTFCVSTQVGCRYRCAFCATGRMGLKRNLTAAEILGQILYLKALSLSPGVETGGETLEGSTASKPGSPEASETPREDALEEDALGEEFPGEEAPGEEAPWEEAPGEEDSGATPEKGEKGFNVVFMGMGEPLDNYANTVKSIRIMQRPEGLAVGGKRITVSTCGIPEKIKMLAKENLGVGLALSLNATTDEQRAKLMPIARKLRLKELLDALQFFAEKSGRRVTLEYVLIAGVNDSPANARRLAAIASTVPCKINLIELNVWPGTGTARGRAGKEAGGARGASTPGAVARGTRAGKPEGGARGAAIRATGARKVGAPPRLEKPSKESVQRFMEILYPRAPAVMLRKSKGEDILAACGQLGAESARRPSRPRQRRKR
ncbi:MAG: 23S rRNA (adenine(2503)-C(2))-methyltransferase RlmN [Candidatus Eisenbacteria bacterium]